MKYISQNKKIIINTIIMCVLTMFLCLYIADDILGLNQPPAKGHISVCANIIFWGSLLGVPLLFHKQIQWKYTVINLLLYFVLYFPLYEICGLKLTHAFLQRGGFLEFPPLWSAILVAVLFWGAQSIVLLICHVIHRIRKR